jgi:hypothetical protein
MQTLLAATGKRLALARQAHGSGWVINQLQA